MQFVIHPYKSKWYNFLKTANFKRKQLNHNEENSK